MSIFSFDESYDGVEEVLIYLKKVLLERRAEKPLTEVELIERINALAKQVQYKDGEGNFKIKEVRQLFDLARKLKINPIRFLIDKENLKDIYVSEDSDEEEEVDAIISDTGAFESSDEEEDRDSLCSSSAGIDSINDKESVLSKDSLYTNFEDEDF